MVAFQVVSSIICPVYGDFYSFPWKRGPHDSVQDYLECVPTYEKLRRVVYSSLVDFDLIQRMICVFQKEEEPKCEIKSSILRMMI